MVRPCCTSNKDTGGTARKQREAARKNRTVAATPPGEVRKVTRWKRGNTPRKF